MWYNKVVQDESKIADALTYFESELVGAKKDVKIVGVLEKNATALPGIVEHRFNQLQELEAILQHFNIQLRKLRRKYFKQYLESYNRALSARDAEKYVDGEDEVVDYEGIINEIALMRNKWLGVIKGLDVKQFQVSNVIRLRTAGMEDVTV